MAQISLHDYLQQIDTLLEENRLSEAIAHCRHILSKFPWHVDTYRLYGKALLEQQKYQDAVDIFRRVLSADPEDFVSHVGLAITHKEQEEIPEAIWHMERAFEMDPYNGAIQDELRGLYANRDGVRPERINLTRGALARLYFRGHLYQQAAAELRNLLSHTQERIDMQTLLAETLWRDDQRVDVVDVCLKILDKLPNCIKANAILAEVWLVSGRNDEAQEYLQRLRMLTRPEKAHLEPDSVVGRAFGATNGSGELPDYTYVEELDYFPVAQELTGDADWVKEFGVSSETDEEANWLDELGDVDVDLFAEAADSDEDMLDWLRDVAVAEEVGEGAAVGGETAVLDDLSDDEESFEWFSDESGDLTPDSDQLGDVPDWLDEVTSSSEAEMWNTALESDEEDEAEPDLGSPAGKAETPDWIRDAALDSDNLENSLLFSEVDDGQTQTLDNSEFEDEEFPSWLDSGSDEAAIPDWLSEGEPGDEFSETDEELPDWLTSPEETVTSDSDTAFPEMSLDDSVFGVSGEEIPDWLLGETAETTEEAEEDFSFDLDNELDLDEGFEDLNFEADDDGLPAWLLEAEEPSASDGETDSDELPDWMLASEEFESGLDAALTAESDTDTDEDYAGLDSFEPGKTADWLSESESDSDDDILPDWLTEADDVALGVGAAVMGAGILDGEDEEDADSEAFELDETADWLSEMEGESDEEVEELPDWLSAAADFDLGPESALIGETEAEDDTGVFESLDFEETADWLSEMEGESDADDEDDEELPDWLSATVDNDLESEAEADDDTEFESFDSDETPDWLSDFDEAEQSGEELPDWLAESPDLVVGQTDIDQESLPDWLEGDEQEGTVREDMLMGNAVDPESNEPDIPEDLDEAMKWLEELAAEQGADLAELPSLQTEQPAEPVGEADLGEAGPVEADDVPDWLKADLSEGDLSTEDDLPDWLKNETASMGDDDWLNLSGEEELPDLEMDLFASEEASFEDDAELSSDSEIPDWLKAQMPEDLQQEAVDDTGAEDDELSWLEQIAAGEGDIEEMPTLSWDSEEEGDPLDVEAEDLPWLTEMPEVVEEYSWEEPVETSLADVDIESADETLQVPDDPDEAMAWLEQLAAQQGAPLDELPTVVDEVPSFSDADTMAEMLAPDIDPEAETVFDLPEDSEESLWEEPVFEELVSEIEVPDDPDEAMAWLEQLAAQQGTSLDELPTVDGPVEEMAVETEETADLSEEAVSEMPTMIEMPEVVEEVEEDDAMGLEIPDDPDEAMAWLEQLAAQQGAPLDELPTVNAPVEEMATPVTGIEMVDFEQEMETEAVAEVEVEAEPESEPYFETELDEDAELEMALAELSDIEMPEDDDEAMAWLEALAGGTVEEEIETAVAEEAVDIPEQTLFDEVEEEPEVVEEIDIFESFDETLSPFELFEAEETPAEVEEPTFEIEEEAFDVSLFDAIDEEPDLVGDSDDEGLAEIETDFEADDLGDALPDWLKFGSISESSQTDLEWLDSIDETSSDNWLEAEEEVSSAVMQTPTPVVEPEPVTYEPPEPEVDETDIYEEEMSTPLAQTGPLDKNQLESARTALEIGDMNTALENYKSLLDAGQNTPLLIAELETETAKHGTNAGLQRLLGDAYMQNGQLQKAIDTYRQALDNL